MCLISFSKAEQYSSRIKLDQFGGQPLWAYINITSRCTHRCGWCYGGFNGHLTDEMRLEDFRVILGKLRDIGILQVTLSGGEPTEHPEFESFIRETRKYDFLTHVVTHGGNLQQFAHFLSAEKVKQVQVNYQGRELHDTQHGVPGAFTEQQKGIRAALAAGLEVTATITVGQYNLAKIPEMFSELNDAGLSRFRIWESTGRGNPWRRGLEAVEIFEVCRTAAARLGFTFIQSYDPEYEGDTGIKCPPMSDLYLHINTAGKLRFCPAVLRDADVADFLSDPVKDILEKFSSNNRSLLAQNDGKAWCVARQNTHATYAG